ncbi:MAG: hypothetical protein CVV37_07175 [Nitrospira bacterium HGW-Nitrospira-1]|nr:MAG: hypothetical protein CVV37_07175 [Nitrospira bacterium HGW-Nitrospira-1]
MKDMLGRENVVDAETALGMLLGNLRADKLHLPLPGQQSMDMLSGQKTLLAHQRQFPPISTSFMRF